MPATTTFEESPMVGPSYAECMDVTSPGILGVTAAILHQGWQQQGPAYSAYIALVYL